MKKIITCPHCHGTGKTEIECCDLCKEEALLRDFKDKKYCYDCWDKMRALELIK